MPEANEGRGQPHVLNVLSVEEPIGPLDDGTLEYELEHPASCQRDVMWSCSHDGVHPENRADWCALGCGRDFNRMEKVEQLRCDVASQEDNCGLAFSLRYSGTPITKPGRYSIQGWWNRTPSTPSGPSEYDAGVAVLEELPPAEARCRACGELVDDCECSAPPVRMPKKKRSRR